MNLSESYKSRLQELAGIDSSSFSKEEYDKQLKHLGIENFEDLIGRTVYYIKPVYGEHKVLKWIPEKGEYLLFTGGQKVFANPFNIIPIPDKINKETDSELKWVIEKLCAEEIPIEIDIKKMSVDDNGELLVTFDMITKDHKYMHDGKRVDVEVSRKGIVLMFSISNNKLESYLKESGIQKILKSSDGNVAGKWDGHAPFLMSNYQTTDVERGYMKKIVEKIILDMI